MMFTTRYEIEPVEFGYKLQVTVFDSRVDVAIRSTRVRSLDEAIDFIRQKAKTTAAQRSLEETHTALRPTKKVARRKSRSRGKLQ